MLPMLKKFKNLILRAEYIRKFAEALNVAEHYVVEELKKVKEDRPYSDFSGARRKEAPGINPTEKLLVRLMLEEAAFINHIRKNLEPADFQDGRIARIVSVMFDLLGQGRDIAPSKLINHLKDDEALQIICESTFLPEISQEEKEKVVDDCIQRLKKQRTRLKKERLHEEIKLAQDLGDEERLSKLMYEFHQLVKMSTQLTER